jgi:hypothetical protein
MMFVRKTPCNKNFPWVISALQTSIFLLKGKLRGVNLLLLFIVLFSSCKHDDVITIADNVALPDHTIEDVSITNYINKVYISVLGREADSAEKQSGFNSLRQSNLSVTSRSQFLDAVFMKPEYKIHLYGLARADLLNDLDTTDITNQILLFNFLLTDSAYMAVWPVLQAEIQKLNSLRAVPLDLQNHAIDVEYMDRRCVNNYFYDQLNMGTENYVVSVFQHFLLRYPTASELAQAKQMVDGFASILFLQSGQSKDDFINIFFSSPDYSEGLARILFRRFLFREPTSVEMGNATMKFSQTHNYVLMQKDILITNEYIGIN